MARVTVEDCVLRIPNRFELVLMASQRARDISLGLPITVERDNDKNPVVALREIADDTVSLDGLRTSLVHGLQRHVERDEPAVEEMDSFSLGADVVFENIAEDADDLNEDGMSVFEGGEEALPGENEE